MTIQYCESYSNKCAGPYDGGGFDFDGGMRNSVMQYNYSHHNQGVGYLCFTWEGGVWNVSDITFRYNISEEDGQSRASGGFETWASGGLISNLNIHNNVVIASKRRVNYFRRMWF